MTHQKLTDAIESSDTETKLWKSRFSAAKSAYEVADFKQCETLLFRSMEQAKALKEHTFATNTCHVGLGALYLATGKLDEAQRHLDSAITDLTAASEDSLKELHAVALRFHAAVLIEKGDQVKAEWELQEAMDILEELDVEGAVQLAYVLSDLATLYVIQDDLEDAKELIFAATDLLERTLGTENPEYVRANMIYSACQAKDDKELLTQVEDGIFRMQYQLGQHHPNITRALRRYLKKLQELGEEDKLKEAKSRFGLATSSR